MDFDRLSEVWRRSGGEAPPGLNEKELAVIKERALAFDRTIRRRDALESAAAVVAIPGFLVMGYATPSTLSRLGAAIIVLFCVFVIYWLRRARRPKPALDQPLGVFLAQELDRVRAQIRLLRSVYWWYFAPPCVGLFLLTIGASGPRSYKVAYLAFVALMCGFLGWGNRRAAERELVPQERDLEAQLASISSSSSDSTNM
jgi:hypothetical protein